MISKIFGRRKNYNVLFDQGLVEIRVAFTTRCSARCTTCLNHTICKQYDLDEDVFRNFVEQVIEIKRKIENPMYFSFFNIGESYLHPHFMELCEWAIPKLKAENIRTSVVTNGSHVKRIPDGIDDFFISFNAGKKETYEEVTGLNFDNVRENILNLYRNEEYKKAQRFQIHMLCFDSNEGEEKDFIETFKEMVGVEYRFSYKYDNQQEKTEHKGIEKEKRRVACDYLTNKISIYPNGDIHSCAHDFQDTMPFGNLKESSLVDILNSDRRKKMICNHKQNKFEGLCEKCDYNCEMEDVNDWFVYGRFGEE